MISTGTLEPACHPAVTLCSERSRRSGHDRQCTSQRRSCPLPLQSNTMSEPIWKSPGWVTALVGLVTAILTIPEIVGNYYTKQQEANESKQDSEFRIVSNTLSQQGLERVFVLRYLAATLDDKDAQAWAADEVTRLDELAASQEGVQGDVAKISEKRRQQAESYARGEKPDEKLQTEIKQLELALAEKNSEVDKLLTQAGISEVTRKKPFAYSIWEDWDFDIFWCDTSGAKAEGQAEVLREALVADGARGRIRTRVLLESVRKKNPDYLRADGYLVRIEEHERPIGEALSVFATRTLSLSEDIEIDPFVPNETIKATPWYVSVFLCPE